MKLSNRLREIAAFLPEGSYFADIGTDHAYLPSYVCLNDPKACAIAGEKTIGPYKRAKKTVETYHLEQRIEVRLGNGLEILGDDPVRELIIAGMGGSLITHILDQGQKYLNSIQRMIIQPNVDEDQVRKWFLENEYVLTEEKIMKENDYIYEILVADRLVGKEIQQPYMDQHLDKQLFFGPFLTAQKSPIFQEKWHMRSEKKKKILKQIKKAKTNSKQKRQKFERSIQWIEEVLTDE